MGIQNDPSADRTDGSWQSQHEPVATARGDRRVELDAREPTILGEDE